METLMNFVNLTPHAVVLRRNDGNDLTIAPSGTVARVDTVPGTEVGLAHVPIYSATSFGEVVGLPESQPDTLYIVSSLVAGRVQRPDVVSPGTGPNDNAVRNDKGHIVAVTRLIRSC